MPVFVRYFPCCGYWGIGSAFSLFLSIVKRSRPLRKDGFLINKRSCFTWGFRFRKSIKCGPFRLNLSKKGIGWSAGVPGFRYTQKAGGGHRTTASIPGTGLSYVKESGSSSRKKSVGRKLNTSSAVPSSVPVSSGSAGAPGPNGPRKPRSAFGVPEILASAFGCFMVLVFLITAATGGLDSSASSSQSSSVPESAIVAVAPTQEPTAVPTA